MPWECKTLEHTRQEFVAKAISKNDSISSLCRQYGISRPTAYKWIERYKNGEDLSNRSHEPLFKPLKTSPYMEELILNVRLQHPTWGARKLKQFLQNKGYEDLPAISTVSNILKRNGCISKQDSEAHTPWKRFEKDSPNQLWQMDFKGHFAMLNNDRCHPLTILDDHSRYSLCIDAKSNEKWLNTKSSIEKVFCEYGLPSAILCDNGKPWGDNHNGYSLFDLWMMQLDILPIHGRPLHPQTQGKEERFHRTMKNDLLSRVPIHNIEHAQKEFNSFRYCYNYERPHGALNLDVPAKHYKPSKRVYDNILSEPQYDDGDCLRKVNYKGYISINRHRYYLGETFIDKYLNVINQPDDIIILCYGKFQIAKIDLNEQLFISKKIYRFDNENCK